MWHDFDLNPGDPRYAEDGKTPCTGVGKIMDYPVGNKRYLGEKWSKCSVEDFTKNFNLYGASRKYCLLPNTGKRRKTYEYCDFDKNYGTYLPSRAKIMKYSLIFPPYFCLLT